MNADGSDAKQLTRGPESHLAAWGSHFVSFEFGAAAPAAAPAGAAVGYVEFANTNRASARALASGQ